MRYRSLYEVAMVSHKSLSQCHFLSCIFTSDTAALPTSGYLSTPSLCSSWCIDVKHSSFPHPKPSFLSTSPPPPPSVPYSPGSLLVPQLVFQTSLSGRIFPGLPSCMLCERFLLCDHFHTVSTSPADVLIPVDTYLYILLPSRSFSKHFYTSYSFWQSQPSIWHLLGDPVKFYEIKWTPKVSLKWEGASSNNLIVVINLRPSKLI